LYVISKTIAAIAIVMTIMNVKFARGSWKKIRSSQYSASQAKMEMGMAKYAQLFPAQMLHRSTTPATIQAAPVIIR